MMGIVSLGLPRERRDCTPGEEASRLKGKAVGRIGVGKLGVGKLGVEGVESVRGNIISWGGVMEIEGRMTKGGVLGGVGIDRSNGAV